MPKYTLVRESYWIDGWDMGIVYIEDEGGQKLTTTANDGNYDYELDIGFSSETDALLHLVNEVLNVEVLTEDRSDDDS